MRLRQRLRPTLNVNRPGTFLSASSPECEGGEVGAEGSVDLAGVVAVEAADDLLLGASSEFSCDDPAVDNTAASMSPDADA